MKFSRTILTVILGAVTALLYFTSDFALIDIEKTAIVVAIGVDKDDDGYTVTAQIAIPKPTETTSVNEDAVMTAKGKTVLEAIDNVGAETGWHPKLSFCSMIFIGNEVAKDEVEHIVDFFVTSEKVDNSATIATCEGKASEVLLSKTPLDAITSFALQKIVLKSEWMVSTVGATNLKTFAVMTNSAGKSAYMPVIGIIHGKTQSEGSQDSSSSGGKSSDEALFDSSSVALFKAGRYCGRLNSEETFLYYLMKAPVYQCYTSVTADDENYFLAVESNERKFLVDATTATVEIGLKLKVSLADSTLGINLKNVSKKSFIPKKVLSALEDKLYSVAYRLFDEIGNGDADIFSIKEHVYRYDNKNFEKILNLSMNKFTFKPTISVASSD